MKRMISMNIWRTALKKWFGNGGISHWWLENKKHWKGDIFLLNQMPPSKLFRPLDYFLHVYLICFSKIYIQILNISLLCFVIVCFILLFLLDSVFHMALELIIYSFFYICHVFLFWNIRTFYLWLMVPLECTAFL